MDRDDFFRMILITSILVMGSAFWCMALSIHRIAQSCDFIQQLQEDVEHLQEITTVLEPAVEEK